MVAFPNCKINIGLNILGKRPDGYHNLQTIYYPLAMNDALEIIAAPNDKQSIDFSSSGISIPGGAENNLCVKAYQLLEAAVPGLPAIEMHLHKVVPMGAGLGGGSADAAFALTLINDKFNLQLPTETLLTYAAELGSDCPFFILNKPCYATGRGEQLTKLSLDLSSYSFLVVHPGIHVSTAEAFKHVTAGTAKKDLRDLVKLPIDAWQSVIFNDFEEPVFSRFPEIGAIKNKLYEYGALYASMSGSGSAVYGIFKQQRDGPLNFPAHYFHRWI